MIKNLLSARSPVLLITTLLVLSILIATLIVANRDPLSYAGRQFTSDFAYDEVCGDEHSGFLIDFDPSWDDIVSFLPDDTRSIWEVPGGFVASSRSDSVDRESIVAKFRLDEGRVNPWCSEPREVSEPEL